MTKEGKNINKLIKRRATIIYLFVGLFAIAILVQVFVLQVLQRDKWHQVQQESSFTKTILPKRGDIISSDGSLLATSIPWYNVTIDMRTKGWDKYLNPAANITKEANLNLDTLCRELRQFIPGKSSYQIKAELKAKYKARNQIYLDKKLNFIELQRLKSLPVLNEGKYKTGLVYHQNSRRVKPYATMAARTIGGIDHKGRGIVGLESAFNSELRGKEGEAVMQKIAGGYWVPADDLSQEPESGDDIVSTINVECQDVVHNALIKQLRRKKADHGCAVLMEVETGNILGISNLVDTMGDYNEYYNYAVGESAEPGSTIKLMSLIAALEDGYIELDDTIDTGNGEFKYAGLTIRDSKKGGYGKLSVKDVFKVSSNVGVVKLILKYYEKQPQKFIDRFYRLNIDKKLGLEIPGEPAPLIRSTSDSLWWKGSLPQISYGYESRLTPLQILAFYNAIANDGKLVKPRFTLGVGVDKRGNVVKKNRVEVIDNSICSRSTIKKAKLMLESVVESGCDEEDKPFSHRGTGYNLVRKSYKIAGKTGTAQIALDNKGYKTAGGKKSYQASFVGYFPADNPKYSCIVVIHSPSRGGYYGNIIAGTVFKEIADKVFAKDFELNTLPSSDNLIVRTPTSQNGFREDLDVVMDEYDIPINDDDIESDWILTFNKDSIVDYKNRIIQKEAVMPNVIGMGLQDAIYIIENKGVKVKVSGIGTVKKQWPRPGEPLKRGGDASIVLS